MLNKKLALLVPILVAVLVVIGNATIFQQMSYQGILTDDVGNRIWGNKSITFRIYNAATNGTKLWEETHSIYIPESEAGIVNVILGSYNPINLDGTQEYWLEIQVSGDTVMTPRIKLTAVPYSMNADHLDGNDASAFYLKTQADDHTQNNIDASKLGGYQPGNSSGNIPVSNGTVDTNLNADMLDGQHGSAFLSAANDWGRPGVAPNLYEGASTLTTLYVNEGQVNSVTSSMISDGSIINGDISNSANISPSKISGTAWTSTNDGSGSGLDADLLDGKNSSDFLNLDGEGRLTLSGSNSTYIIKAENNGSGYGIQAHAHGVDACGVYASADANDGKAIYGYAGVSGTYAIYGNGRSQFVRYSGAPAVNINNQSSSGLADALAISAPNSNESLTWALSVRAKKGNAIYAYKTEDDNKYTAYIKAASSNEEALYVYGDFTVQYGTKSAVVKTSAGYEPLFCVESPEVEFYSNGTAQLTNGTASVAFSRLFSEAISPDVPVKVIATPVGSWSGIYLEDANSSGFTVRSEAGDLDATFNWIAIGRRKGYEQTPEITVPDLEEMETIRQQKEAMRQEE